MGVELAQRLIRNLDECDMYGSLQNIAKCMQMCADIEYLQSNLYAEHRLITSAERLQARKNFNK
jgi:hypothetical protein